MPVSNGSEAVRDYNGGSDWSVSWQQLAARWRLPIKWTASHKLVDANNYARIGLNTTCTFETKIAHEK